MSEQGCEAWMGDKQCGVRFSRLKAWRDPRKAFPWLKPQQDTTLHLPWQLCKAHYDATFSPPTAIQGI